MSADDPRLLMSFDLGPNRWPPDPDEGFAVVKFGATYKLDPQKPNGKDDPSIKNVGREARKFSAELHWTSRIDSDARAYIKQISPVGINQGKSWDLRHIDQELYNVDAVELDEMGEIERGPNERKVTIKGISWNRAQQIKVGTGATTPAAPVSYTNPDDKPGDVTFTTSTGNVINMGPGPITQTTSTGNVIGFNGADAPKPSVP